MTGCKPQLAGGSQLAIYKRGRGFELGTTENKSSKWPERDSNPGPPDCESEALTTRPRCYVLLLRRNFFVMDPDNEAGEKSAILVRMYSITLQWWIQGFGYRFVGTPPPPPKCILQSSKHLVSCDEIEMVNCEESHTTLNSQQMKLVFHVAFQRQIYYVSQGDGLFQSCNLGQNKMEQQALIPPKSRMKPREGQNRAIFPSLIWEAEAGRGLGFPYIFSKIVGSARVAGVSGISHLLRLS